MCNSPFIEPKWTQLDVTVEHLERRTFRQQIEAAAQAAGCELMFWFPDSDDRRDEHGRRVWAKSHVEFCFDVELSEGEFTSDFRRKLADSLRRLAEEIER